MKKGQFALEFVILISFTLLFSAIFLIVIQKSYVSSQKMQEADQINQIMRIISSEVNLAELSPPGYMREFYVPFFIEGGEYTISSSDDVDIVFNYNDKEYVFFLAGFNNSNTYSALKGACSCLKPGFNTIKKECPPNSVCIIRLMMPSSTDPSGFVPCLFAVYGANGFECNG